MPRKTNKQLQLDDDRGAKPSDRQPSWIKKLTENEAFTKLHQADKRWELPRGVQLVYSRKSEAHKQAEIRRNQKRKGGR